jgi:integrase
LIRNVIGPLSERFPSPEGEKGFKDARLHSFRHFFCSRMATVGTPQLVLQKWLGHRNSAMVQHYFDLSDADSHARMSSIELLPATKPGAVDN